MAKGRGATQPFIVELVPNGVGERRVVQSINPQAQSLGRKGGTLERMSH